MKLGVCSERLETTITQRHRRIGESSEKSVKDTIRNTKTGWNKLKIIASQKAAEQTVPSERRKQSREKKFEGRGQQSKL